MTRDELLERGDETVTLRQIVERFEAVEKEYSGIPWTLKQIYQQIGMLVSEKPKKGHWINCIDDNGSSYYLCSACRCGEDFKFDFCPNCGSDNMEVKE